MNGNEALDTASDVGVIMLYHDFLDKINDKDGIKSLLCRLVLPELKRLRKKACKSSEMIAEFEANRVYGYLQDPNEFSVILFFSEADWLNYTDGKTDKTQK